MAGAASRQLPISMCRRNSPRLLQLPHFKLLHMQIEALRAAGVTEVVLAISYKPDVSCLPAPCKLRTPPRLCNKTHPPGPPALVHAQVMMGFISEWQEKLGVKITCSQVR